jgi:alpha-beta hydrolase superfamily lysophospholipase
VSAGVAVHTYDALGHGRSPALPKRGRWNVERFSDLVDDAAAFSAAQLEGNYASAPPPAFIMGQSLGCARTHARRALAHASRLTRSLTLRASLACSLARLSCADALSRNARSGLVSAYTALREPARWARGGLVLMSAAADVEWTPMLHAQAAVGAALSALLPNAALVPAVRVEDLSRDPAVVAEFKADPLVCHANTKCRLGFECLNAFRALQPRYKEISVPLLAMHGTADKITSLPAVRRLVEAAASTDKTLVPIEGAYHELFNEPEQGAVLERLTAWVLERAQAPAKL